ncbi:MAG TPA: EamA family transporter [Armatimonadota bacterium]|nr:EamA family transporter [Armatimonadota bacterium]
MTPPAEPPSPGARTVPTKPSHDLAISKSESERLESEERASNDERAAVKGGFIPEASRHAFIVAMVIAVLAASAGDTILKRGMMDLVSPATASFLTDGLKLVSNIFIEIGAMLMIVHFIAFIRALKLGPLSAAVPLRSSSYVLTTLLAKYWLGENVNAERWIAIFLILFGVSIIGRSTEGGDNPEDGASKRHHSNSVGISRGKGPAEDVGA